MDHRTKTQRIEGVQNTLESYRRFDKTTIAYGEDWTMPDGNYRYHPAIYDRVANGFWRVTLFVLSPLVLKVGFGARVEGKENLRALKGRGAITLCNHIHHLDTLFVRKAVGQFRSHHTMAPWNNKDGLGGHIIRHGGMLPLSSDLSAMRNFNAEVERLLKSGKLVNFYPEQVMWWTYQKPRPMKDGAFHYAVKYGVPVLPIFCTFRRTRRCGIRRLVIHILPPIYADDSLPRKERIEEMKLRAEQAWKTCYEEAYGMPLEYLPDRRHHT